MKINCETAVPVRDARATAVIKRKCGKPAVILIVTNYDDDLGTGLIATGFCEEHSAEEIDNNTGGADGFVVVNLTAEARLKRVREYALRLATSPFAGMRPLGDTILEIINGDVSATEFEGGCIDVPEGQGIATGDALIAHAQEQKGCFS